MTVEIANAQTNQPKTLLEFAGVESKPGNLRESVLVIIDAQKEFTTGKLKLPGIETATGEARKILDRARKFNIPVIHVRHHNKPGAALFDPDSKFAEDINLLKPESGEIIVNKSMANAFVAKPFEIKQLFEKIQSLLVA